MKIISTTLLSISLILCCTFAVARKKNGQTELHDAAYDGHFSRVDAYMKLEGSTCNEVDNARQTPLHMAAGRGNAKMIEVLLDFGCDPNIADSEGETPLHRASEKLYHEAVKALIAGGANVNAQSKVEKRYNWTPIFYAFLNRGGHRVMLELMNGGADLNARTGENQTPLHMAAMGKDAVAIRQFIKRGCDPNALTHSKSTALHMSAMAGDGVGIKQLLPHIKNINALDNESMTGLHFASHFGHKDAVRTLLEAGADCSLLDGDNGLTPLQLAIDGDHVETVAVMLEQGCDKLVPSGAGQTALALASSKGNADIIALLSDAVEEKEEL